MEQDSEKIEIVIEVDQEIKDKIDVFQSKTGITDDEILIYGIYKILKDLHPEEIFRYISLDNYETILNYSESVLKKLLKTRGFYDRRKE